MQGGQHRVPDATQAPEANRAAARASFSLPVLCPMHKDRVARVPHFLFTRMPPPGAHLLIYAVSTAQCQFTQGDQIAFAEKMFNGALRLPAIDFAFFQPLAQIVRRPVHSTTSSAASKKKGSGTFSHA